MRKSESKIVIITGGIDSVSIATIHKFSESGSKAIIWDNNERKGKLLISQLKAQKLNVEFQHVDTTNLSQTEKASKEVFEKYKRIDILINNSYTIEESEKTSSQEEWHTLLNKSLTGLSNCIKTVHPYMLLNNSGRILNTTALLGLYGEINQTNYNAVKNGVLGISKIWAQELSKHGITVNTIAPGYIESDYIKSNTAAVLKSIKEKIPAKKIGKASDIANAYFFLASPESSYITGAVLNVDGGYVV